MWDEVDEGPSDGGTNASVHHVRNEVAVSICLPSYGYYHCRTIPVFLLLYNDHSPRWALYPTDDHDLCWKEEEDDRAILVLPVHDSRNVDGLFYFNIQSDQLIHVGLQG